MIRRTRVSLAIVFTVGGCCSTPSLENGIIGVWQIQTIQRKNADSISTNTRPLPSLAIFTSTHYSLVWMPGEKGMREFQKRWNPTDEEKIQRYGEIVVNAGTYNKTESKLTLIPVVSRFPEFMGGGRLLYEYSVVGDTLSLTAVDEYSYDGIQAPWAAAGNRVTLTLTRIGRTDDRLRKRRRVGCRNEKRPNKSPEPTPTAVTPRANK